MDGWILGWSRCTLWNNDGVEWLGMKRVRLRRIHTSPQAQAKPLRLLCVLCVLCG